MTMLTLDRIVADSRAQLRAGLDEETVQHYAEEMRQRARFPALVVFYDRAEDVYYLADGFHRLAAAKIAGRDRLHVRVLTGTIRDAMLYAAGCNARHGLPRTNADKRRTVLALLTDLEWRQWSDREIARRCAVSDRMVGRLRAEIEAPLPVIPEPTRMVRRGQVLYPMRIRERRRAAPLPVSKDSDGFTSVGLAELAELEVLAATGAVPVSRARPSGGRASAASSDLPVSQAGGAQGRAGERNSGARPASRANDGVSRALDAAQPASSDGGGGLSTLHALPVSLALANWRERCYALESENKHLRVLLALAGIPV